MNLQGLVSGSCLRWTGPSQRIGPGCRNLERRYGIHGERKRVPNHTQDFPVASVWRCLIAPRAHAATKSRTQARS